MGTISFILGVGATSRSLRVNDGLARIPAISQGLSAKESWEVVAAGAVRFLGSSSVGVVVAGVVRFFGFSSVDVIVAGAVRFFGSSSVGVVVAGVVRFFGFSSIDVVAAGTVRFFGSSSVDVVVVTLGSSLGGSGLSGVVLWGHCPCQQEGRDGLARTGVSRFPLGRFCPGKPLSLRRCLLPLNTSP